MLLGQLKRNRYISIDVSKRLIVVGGSNSESNVDDYGSMEESD